MYTLGPYLIGLVAGVETRYDLLEWQYLLLAIYFTLPANLLIYGVNDIFDYETDSINKKKESYETLVTPTKQKLVATAILVCNLPFILVVPFLPIVAIAFVTAFLFLSYYYSAPPVRTKAVPFLDSIFNILYACPGFAAFAIVTSGTPSIAVISASGLWTAAMHAYSAIPDIEVDTKAKIDTVATALGSNGTHLFCMACYTAASFAAVTFAPPLMLLGLVYIFIIRFSLNATDPSDLGTYRAFPFINAACGFIIFWYVAWPKLSL